MGTVAPLVAVSGARTIDTSLSSSLEAPQLADDRRWFVQRTAAVLLDGTRSAQAVQPLEGLLRRSDARVLRATVAALARIDDPAAARALPTVLRAATESNRVAVVEALVAEKDPRAVPMLARILSDADPFGPDHGLVLDTLDAVRQLADDRAVPAVTAVMGRRKFLARRKAMAFKAAAEGGVPPHAAARRRRRAHPAADAGDAGAGADCGVRPQRGTRPTRRDMS